MEVHVESTARGVAEVGGYVVDGLILISAGTARSACFDMNRVTITSSTREKHR